MVQLGRKKSRKKIGKKPWKNVLKWQKITFFRRFGGSATSTEASAELFWPKMAEASAEASVSVVHYYPECL